MSRLIVNGGRELSGETEVQGAKNSVLPILAGTILTKGENVLHNCPDLSDVSVAQRILRYLGCNVKSYDDTILVNADGLTGDDIPDNLMREMRGSIIFLGPLISRVGKAKLTFPGGCELGPRPIDLHLKALSKMGVTITEHYGVIECVAEKGLKGADITLSFPSVGATENIILSAVTAKGTTTITNAAREPEISDLCEYLISCGAKIYGCGEGVITIDGVSSLNSTQHTIIPDRIVIATLMCCAGITGSSICIKGVIKNHLNSVIPVFEEVGCTVDIFDGNMYFKAPKSLGIMPLIRTMPYPGFPTDAQAPLMAMATMCQDASVFVENIFENRFKHIDELVRLGAKIYAQGKVAVVNNVKRLYGAKVQAKDLRGAASLVVASLAAQGTTEISGINFLERGYEDFEVVLSNLGASINKM